jgi:tetratricopeptide (TPR) repeat protein
VQTIPTPADLSVTLCNLTTASEAPLPVGKEKVSSENNKKDTQEEELWERIGTTSGAERAEVLDELSHIAYRKDNYTECLQLIDTSIDIYDELGRHLYTKELIHLYEGKAFCLSNLKKSAESAETFEMIASLYASNEDNDGYLRATRAAAREWYEAEEWEKSLSGHSAAQGFIDPDATPYSMGIDTLNISMAMQKLDRHEEAVTNLLTARQIFKDDKNPEYVNWCDSYLAASYVELRNGMEAKFHATHYYNYSNVIENLDMEPYARYRLGQAHRLLREYEDAQHHFKRALQLITLDDHKDWETIIKLNHELAAVLFAQGKDHDAKKILNRIATIEETMDLGE